MSWRTLCACVAMFVTSCAMPLGNRDGSASDTGGSAATGAAGSGGSETDGGEAGSDQAGASSGGASQSGASNAGAENAGEAGSSSDGGSAAEAGSSSDAGSPADGGSAGEEQGGSENGGAESWCDTATACTPGETNDCVCASGEEGSQTCNASCTYDACVCEPSGTGGASSTGGTSSTGGSDETGGAEPQGGTSTTGGTSSTGGTPSTGGMSDTGGTPSTGGISSTGGSDECPPCPPIGGTGGVPDGYALIHLRYTAPVQYDVTEIQGIATDRAYVTLDRPWPLDPAYADVPLDLIPLDQREYVFAILQDGVNGPCYTSNGSGTVSCDVVVPTDALIRVGPHYFTSDSTEWEWAIVSTTMRGSLEVWDAAWNPIHWSIDGAFPDTAQHGLPGRLAVFTSPAR